MLYIHSAFLFVSFVLTLIISSYQEQPNKKGRPRSVKSSVKLPLPHHREVSQQQCESTQLPHQAPHYASLINPGTIQHNYTELIIAKRNTSESSKSDQQLLQVHTTTATSQGNLNTMPQQIGDYTALINRPEDTSHGYQKLTRPEKSSKSASDHEQFSKVYSTVVRQDGQKVTVRYTISDPPDEHQIENPALADGNKDFAMKNIISRSSSRDVTTAPVDKAVQESATYCTVVRQGGEKVTIRIQAPTEEQDPW